jgi:hypothetical protein
MSNTDNKQTYYRYEDVSVLAAIIAGFVAIISAFFGGLWPWLSGRKKAVTDERALLISGFVSLLAAVQKERDTLIDRVAECEANNQKQDRRIGKLERAMIKHHIALPPDEE